MGRLIGAAALALLVSGCYQPKSSVIGAGAQIKPEQERKAWIPPETDLPQSLIDTTAFLYEVGLSDPRGGEFRRATIEYHSSTFAKTFKGEAVGWVKQDPETGVQTVVTLNGLERRALETGELIDVDEFFAEQEIRSSFSGGFMVDGDKFPPVQSLMSLCLLLLAGETGAAEELYHRTYESETERGQPHEPSLIYMYVESRFLRSVSEHLVGDFEEAAHEAKILLDNRSKIEERLGSTATRIDFLDPLDSYYRDAIRRIERGDRQVLTQEQIAALVEKRDVATLIEHLDDYAAAQYMQPGGLNVSGDPINAALFEIGDDAVEPLIDVCENDTRLTKAVSYHRDFFPMRKIWPVKEVAYHAIEQILDYPQIEKYKSDQPPVALLRKYWESVKNLPQDERYFLSLADDTLESHRWIAAVNSIVRRTGFRRDGPMQGESLRDKTSPSVSDLMSKRALQMMGEGRFGDSGKVFELANALRLGHQLFDWDSEVALPTLQALSERLTEGQRNWTNRGGAIQSAESEGAIVLVERLRLNDETAVADFEDLIWKAEPDSFHGSARTLFAPAILFPDALGMHELLEKAFGDESFPWHVTRLKFFPRDRALSGVMLTMDAYRSAVLGLLSDRRPVGETWIQGDQMKFELDAGGSGGFGPRKEAAGSARPADGVRTTLRKCDLLGLSLTNFDGAPSFQPYWPEDERDRAIIALKGFIEENAQRLPELDTGRTYSRLPKWWSNEPATKK